MCVILAMPCKGVIFNEGHCGYLGDHLINYIKAKYLSYKYNIPFQLRSFNCSEEFVLSDVEPRVSPATFSGGRRITHESQLQGASRQINFRIVFSCILHGCLGSTDMDTWNPIIENMSFRDQMRMLIAPKNPIKLSLPDDQISVGVHIRRTRPEDDGIVTTQFYQVEQLKKIKQIRMPTE